ncbi:hypothetical protein FJM67_11705 [Maribrevibacterium harenarium]|uniref:Uncharacterized protein n=1 Tax=Maribrevibacterium harenarium TaxID=2589817 RepID=A0A501WMT4_9GAMM|nr:hypothetical protein FJM67_11705 [Maribrevibacterium harenarium]
MIEVIKARCLDHGIEVKEVNQAYTSQIGKQKFSVPYGLTPNQLLGAQRSIVSNPILRVKPLYGHL